VQTAQEQGHLLGDAMAIAPVDEATKIQHVREDLTREFPNLPRSLVASQVDAVALRLADARVRTFVPVLVRRGARTQLRQLA